MVICTTCSFPLGKIVKKSLFLTAISSSWLTGFFSFSRYMISVGFFSSNAPVSLTAVVLGFFSPLFVFVESFLFFLLSTISGMFSWLLVELTLVADVEVESAIIGKYKGSSVLFAWSN